MKKNEKEPMNLFFEMCIIYAKNPKWEKIEEAYGPETVADLKGWRKVFGTDG